MFFLGFAEGCEKEARRLLDFDRKGQATEGILAILESPNGLIGIR
jgi:hypothetical protein